MPATACSFEGCGDYAWWVAQDPTGTNTHDFLCHRHLRMIREEDWFAASQYFLLTNGSGKPIEPLPALSGKSAVVCENNAVTIMQFARCLEHHGASVAEVTEQGAKAVELVERHEPDLILMARHLVDMDGFEAARVIREWDPNTCIVMCSADTQLDNVLRANDMGLNGWIRKPIVCDELALRLEMILSPRST